MKKITISVALFAALAALALPVMADDARMRSTCEWQMLTGVCAIKLNRQSYGPNVTHIIVNKKRVQIDAMLTLQNSDNTMCQIGSMACAAGAAGTALQKDICHIARAKWGQ